MARRLLVGIALGLALLVVLDAIAARIGIAPGAIPKVPGTFAWTTSRAAGVTAFLALTMELLFGLFLSTGVADKLISRAQGAELHRWLSSIVLSLIAVHGLVLTADSFVGFDVLDALLPWLSSYRSFAVSLGVLAAYGALVVHISSRLRRRLGAKTWRRLHYLSFFVFVAGAAHGVLAGSDSHSRALQTVYIVSGTLVGALSLYRVLASGTPRASRGLADVPVTPDARPKRHRAS